MNTYQPYHIFGKLKIVWCFTKYVSFYLYACFILPLCLSHFTAMLVSFNNSYACFILTWCLFHFTSMFVSSNSYACFILHLCLFHPTLMLVLWKSSIRISPQSDKFLKIILGNMLHQALSFVIEREITKFEDF